MAGTPLKAMWLRDPCKGQLGQWVTKPQGPGAGAKIGTTSWPGSLPPGWRPNTGPVAREPPKRRGWGAWNLGWGSMTPHSCDHDNQVAEEGLQLQIPEEER